VAQNPYEAPQHVGGLNIPVPHIEHEVPWVEPTRSKILNVAANQRWVNIHFLVAIVGGILVGAFMPDDNPRRGGASTGNIAVMTVLLIFLIPNVLGLIYRVYRLSSALGYSMPVLVALGSILGIIGIVIVALLSGEANKYLKKFNIKTGLLGVNPQKVSLMLDEAQRLAQGPGTLPVAQAWPAPGR
jgi:hypothetical protein